MESDVDPELVEATVDARRVAHNVDLVEKARRGQPWWLWVFPAGMLVVAFAAPPQLGAVLGIVVTFAVATWLAWRTNQRLDALASLLLDDRTDRKRRVG